MKPPRKNNGLAPGSLLLNAAIVVFLAVAPARAGEGPAEYRDRNGWLGVQLDQQPSEGGGMRIQSVVSGGPAQRSGLRDNDVILEVGGAKATDLQALVRLISGTEPGSKVLFRIRRGDRETDVEVIVGHRSMGLGPMIEGGREIFRSNDEIRPEWAGVGDDFSAWLKTLLESRGSTGILDDLLTAFERDEDVLRGFYKLDEVSYVRRDPLKLPLSAKTLTASFAAAAAANSPGEMVRRAAAYLDAGIAQPHDFPASPECVIESVAFASGLVNRAFGALSGGERAFLFEQSVLLFDKFVEHIYINELSSEVMLRNNLEAIRLSKKIDWGLLFQAGAEIAELASSARRIPASEWAAFASGRGISPGAAHGDVIAAFESPIGLVIVGGPGRTVYEKDAALIVDLGGDDVYLNNAGASTKKIPVSVVLDYGGNDTYRGGPVSQGAGRLGVGLLADFGGDDVYHSPRYCQGCGLFGVGILFDESGDDRYSSGEYHAGAGLFGIGICFDAAGSDSYSAHLYSQGFGATKGFGLLLDAAGSDSYYASGKYPSSYGTPGVFNGMSQGFGIGFRQIASGGMGVLADLSGNDHYVAGNFSQGGGYFLGYGILHDFKGDDRYDGSRYSQGFGVHSAVGILIDGAGDDRYRCEVAANQGSAWDLGVGFLLDEGGNDRYEAHGLSQGGSSMNGFSALIDLGGDDFYHALGDGQGFGGENTYAGGRGALNLGILVDAGGGKDSYNRAGRKDGVLLSDEKGGVFADLPGSLREAIEALRNAGKKNGSGGGKPGSGE